METKLKHKLAKRLKELRKERGMTQEELATITGLDYKYVQRIEGKNPPAIRIDTIERLAKAFKISSSKLLSI